MADCRRTLCLLDNTDWEETRALCLVHTSLVTFKSEFLSFTRWLWQVCDYTLRYGTNFRIYFSVSGQAVTDHPFLCSPGIPQVGTELLPLRPGSCPDPGGLPGRECVNSIFGGGCPEPSLVCFSVLITCDHRDAGYCLSLCTVCEIINVFGRSPN